jgi:hypothetical protein
LFKSETYRDVPEVVREGGGVEVEYNCNVAETSLATDESFEARNPDEDP